MSDSDDASSPDDDPEPKRRRVEVDDDPNQQLEAMLAANNSAAFGGAPGGIGVGVGMSGFTGVLGGPGGMPPPGGGTFASRAQGGFSGGGLSGGGGFSNFGDGGAQAAPKIETTRMDFTKLVREQPTSFVSVQKELVEHLMTPEHRKLLTEETGATVEWVPEEAKVALGGSAEQVKRAQRLLARVMMHCRWGYSEEKVRRLLKPRKIESVLVRLSPMNTLRPAEKTLSPGSTIMTVGKDRANDVVVPDALISRQHCVLELDEDRGAVYILDTSTNGTFLNNVRLPSKTVGKVLLSHGDEMLLKDPAGGDREFGYMVNLNVINAQAEVPLVAPRRLLTPEEATSTYREPM